MTDPTPQPLDSTQYSQDLLRIKSSSKLTTWIFLLGRIYKSFRTLLILILGVLAIRRYMHTPFNSWDIAISLMLFMPLLVLFVLPKTVAYSQTELSEEFYRGNFDRVLDLVTKYIKTALAYRSPTEVATVSTEHRARCLAKKGKLKEGLALVDLFRLTFPEVPFSKYTYIKASTYASANQFEDVLNCYKVLTEKEPDNTIGWLGMIDPLALHLNRPAEARACLERARTLDLTPDMQGSFAYLEAMVNLSEGNYAEAKSKFEEQLPQMEALAEVSPIGEGWRAMMLAQLAIACAHLGDLETAKDHFERARPMLEVQNFEALLERCKRELGINE